MVSFSGSFTRIIFNPQNPPIDIHNCQTHVTPDIYQYHITSLPSSLPKSILNNQISLFNILLFKQIITGIIHVQNIKYHKLILVNYTFDNWNSTIQIPANYDCSLDSKTDQFSFKLDISSIPSPYYSNCFIQKILYFYLSYTVDNQTFYDNNNGSNYRIIVSKHTSQKKKKHAIYNPQWNIPKKLLYRSTSLDSFKDYTKPSQINNSFYSVDSNNLKRTSSLESFKDSNPTTEKTPSNDQLYSYNSKNACFMEIPFSTSPCF